MGRLPRWHRVVDVACQEAALAGRLCNDPAEKRGLEGFIVHMNQRRSRPTQSSRAMASLCTLQELIVRLELLPLS